MLNHIECLDEVVFEQQGLGFAANHRGFHAHDARHHVANAGATVVLMEIARNATFEVSGLAHVQQVVLGIEIPIDPGQVGPRWLLPPTNEPRQHRGARAAHCSQHCQSWCVIVPIMAAMLWDIFCRVIDNFGDIGVLAPERRSVRPRSPGAIVDR